ncbi:MAG: hypothetical protein COB15_00440 [Flavobacteriales bacterium]|nr:MAG: hypothetical protein COB15_00440 [Flavobacteriales bacterium]
MKILFAITTANQLSYTIKIIQSIRVHKNKNIDVVIFDDASNDGTQEWCKKNNLEIITKKTPEGLTHSWNLAYKKFKNEDYSHLILSNNDLIIPVNAIENLIEANNKFVIAGPLSTKKGVGHQPLQNVKLYYDINSDEYEYKNTSAIQNVISEDTSSKKSKQVDFINGFIFSMDRRIIDYERSDGNIFDPKNINVGNESELCERVKPNIGIALKAYIFHFKGVSFKDINFDNQPFTHNVYRDLNWQEAEQLKKNPLKKLLFKLKRKFK